MSDLQMIRGDTAKFKFQRLDNNGDPILSQADSIYFTVKIFAEDAQAVLQKTADDMTLDESGFYHFTIEPADTDKLRFGSYDYDLEVVDEDIKTTIAFGKFTILPEVTWAQNESEE